MGIQAFISGIWRTPTKADAYVNGAWRRLIRAEAYIGGQWRQIASFVLPLTVTANNAVRGGNFSGSADRTLTATSTCTPSGGRGPYIYSWVVTSGGFTVTNATMATASFTGNVPAETQRTGTAQVTCTDASGQTASTDITITLRNFSSVGGTS